MTPNEVQYPKSVPPSLLIPDNNRFGIKRGPLEILKASILAEGRILVPLEVEPVENGKFRITDGHYRHAAATELSKEHDGVECPIEVHVPDGVETEQQRVMRQTAFNYVREGLSPMDIAVAARSLMKSGMSRQEVRDVFKKGGGRKGSKVSGMSNSYLNIHLSFLDFPKAIQTKIHEGTITMSGAMDLVDRPRDKWDAIIAQCEKDAEDAAAKDVKREDKFLAAEQAEAERKAQAEQLAKDAEAAKAKVEEVTKLKADKMAVEAQAFTAHQNADGEAKKAANEALKSAGADVKGAMAAVEEATKEAAKAQAKLDKYNADAEARRKRLEDLRKGAKAPAIGKDAVAKAAKKVDGDAKVKLNATDMRKYVEGWALPGNPKVQAICQIILQAFNSELTDKQAYDEMSKITGEYTPKKKK